MAFRSANLDAHMTSFNSATSSDFLDYYDKLVCDEIIQENSSPKHKTFAPSSFRCDRINWFRLRGVQPDSIKEPDKLLRFTADVGTSIHELIQSRLSANMGDNWLNVDDYIKAKQLDYDYDVTTKGYETLVEIRRPYPVRFAVDGLLNFKGNIYLLEIKTSEYSSFQDLIRPKDRHVDQIKCYCTLLDIKKALVFYVDRQYGGTKCFEMSVSDSEKNEVRSKMDNIMKLADACIAPEPLPKGDVNCTSSMCPYYKTCTECWGR